MRCLCAASFVLALTSGCYQSTLNVPGTIPGPDPNYSSYHGHLLFGLVDLVGPLDLRATCPTGISQIETYLGPLGAIVSVITFGIFTPVTVQVFCDTVVVMPAANPQLTPPAPPPIMTPLPPSSPPPPAPAAPAP